MKRRSEFQLHQHLADHLERHRTYNDEGTGRAIPRINRSFRYGVGLLLLLAGLSLAAQTPTQGSAELKHGQSYSTDADEITNTTVTWFHGWEFELGNHGGAQIQNPVIQMQTFLPMIGFPQNDPSYFTANPAQGIYIWNFTGYDLTAGAQFSVDAEDSSVVAPPGFSISRTVSPELLTGASTQQTVTVTLTIEQALPADVNALEIYFGSFPSIVNGTTLIDSQFVSQAPVAGWTAWAAGTTVVGWSIPPANVQVGQTYTFQAVLNNVKSPQLLGSPDSKPGVTFDFERTTVLPPVTANSVTIHHPTEPISFTAATGTLVNWQRLVSDSEVGVRIHPLQPMIEGPRHLFACRFRPPSASSRAA